MNQNTNVQYCDLAGNSPMAYSILTENAHKHIELMKAIQVSMMKHKGIQFKEE